MANNDNDNDNDEERRMQRSDDHDAAISKVNELAYCISSFSAVFPPVSLTMILSALVVVFVNTDQTRSDGADAYATTYEVVDLEEGNSGQNLFASVINTLIIVCVIGIMTFVVVLLYKYRCLKVLLGYMILVTTMLLGYYTTVIGLLSMEIYNWSVDTITFGLFIYNFAAVGTLAIFYGKGIPLWVTQGYLMASSVILAWQLSFFGDWTAWTLLVMLALYDLFAVLTPCGPLKALVHQMSKPDAPALPSLLYEAPLPRDIRRPNRNPASPAGGGDGATGDGNSRSNAVSSSERPTDERELTQAAQDNRPASTTSHDDARSTAMQSGRGRITVTQSSDEQSAEREGVEMVLTSRPAARTSNNTSDRTRAVIETAENTDTKRSNASVKQRRNEVDSRRDQQAGRHATAPPPTTATAETEERRVTRIALAVAKMYKLKVVDTDGRLNPRSQTLFNTGRSQASNPRVYTVHEVRTMEWTAKQLKTEIQVDFPMDGGWIERATGAQKRSIDENGKQYVAYFANGQIARRFLVNKDGKVFSIRRSQNANNDDDGDGDRSSRRKPKAANSIKLGLGDFIFYSILVSKAALHSFTSFVACMLVILTGLGGTLILLAVFGKALPALPISIFLGVTFYLLTRVLIEPWIQTVLNDPFYV